jgi:AcrR family transcriptional regulator
MNSRTINKTATRGKILAVTRMLVSERGFAAVTTADVAKASGLSHGAIFVHFPNRDALIDAVVEDFGIRIATWLHELSERGADLKSLLRAHLDAIRSDEMFYTALVNERFLLPQNARDTFTSVQSTISHHFEERLVAETGGKCAADHAMLFNTWIALVHYYLGHRDLFVQDGESVIDRLGPKLISHFMSLAENT